MPGRYLPVRFRVSTWTVSYTHLARIFESSLDEAKITAPCGNVNWLQCSKGCTKDIWERGEVPDGICPHCGAQMCIRDRHPTRTAAIVLAAGQGKRMKSNIQKQFLLLEEKPVIWYAPVSYTHLDVYKRQGKN